MLDHVQDDHPGLKQESDKALLIGGNYIDENGLQVLIDSDMLHPNEVQP